MIQSVRQNVRQTVRLAESHQDRPPIVRVSREEGFERDSLCAVLMSCIKAIASIEAVPDDLLLKTAVRHTVMHKNSQKDIELKEAETKKGLAVDYAHPDLFDSCQTAFRQYVRRKDSPTENDLPLQEAEMKKFVAADCTHPNSFDKLSDSCQTDCEAQGSSYQIAQQSVTHR